MSQRQQFVPVDRLGRMVQEAIDELVSEGELDPPEGRSRSWRRLLPRSRHQYEGYCARSCQAYVFLARDARTRGLASDPDAEPRSRKDRSHYWLETRGAVMELNLGPRETPNQHYPYADSRSAWGDPGFWKYRKDPRLPHRIESQRIVQRVWERVDNAKAP